MNSTIKIQQFDQFIPTHFLGPSMISLKLQTRKFIAFDSPLRRNPSHQLHFSLMFRITLNLDYPKTQLAPRRMISLPLAAGRRVKLGKDSIIFSILTTLLLILKGSLLI